MTTPLDALAERVDGYLLRLGVDGDVTAEGFWSLRFGSTVVMVSTLEADGHTYVRLASIVLIGAQTTLDLLTRILRLNNETLFGAFQLFDDQTVAFTHTLPGDKLEFEAFEAALRYVARVGDDHDEDLQALAGGERAEDAIGQPTMDSIKPVS